MSFAISASLAPFGLDHGVDELGVELSSRRGARGRETATTFGVFLTPKVGLPGSIRSGEKAMCTSSPSVRREPRTSGAKTSSVVPG